MKHLHCIPHHLYRIERIQGCDNDNHLLIVIKSKDSVIDTFIDKNIGRIDIGLSLDISEHEVKINNQSIYRNVHPFDIDVYFSNEIELN